MTQLTPQELAKLQALADTQAEVNGWSRDRIVSLDIEHFALACRALKSQSYGALGERWLCDKLGLTRVTGNKDYDAVSAAGKRFEVKFTIAPPTGKFNVVQIRPQANLDGYLIFAVNSSNTAQIWQLSKDDMTNECRVLKAGSAHGKRDPNNPDQELRLSFTEGDLTYHRWNKMYQVLPNGRW